VLACIEDSKLFQVNKVENLQVMKTGMTNFSYSFEVEGKRYIIRLPGGGTADFIDRQQECEVYKQINRCNIGEEQLYFNAETGVKISVFMDDARVCDPFDKVDVARCMAALRKFHNLRLTVPHTFDLWERMEHYAYLRGLGKSVHTDYDVVCEEVKKLRAYVEREKSDYILCHIDAVPDNFLFVPGDTGEAVKLIDWEYAGMQDPHLDIAMYGIYAMYDRSDMENLIDAYFAEGCPARVRLKIYAYIAIAGLVWSNWCEYKRCCGLELGAYAQKQYEYAAEYTKIFKEEFKKEFGYEYETTSD